MIKSTLQSNIQTKESIPEYPKLMISPDKDVIILVSKQKPNFKTTHFTGTVVYSERPSKPLGAWSEYWVIGDYKEYHGSVLLEGIPQ